MENVAKSEFYLGRGSKCPAFLDKQITSGLWRGISTWSTSDPIGLRPEKQLIIRLACKILIHFSFFLPRRMSDAQLWMGWFPNKVCATSPKLIPLSTNPTEEQRDPFLLFKDRHPLRFLRYRPTTDRPALALTA